MYKKRDIIEPEYKFWEDCTTHNFLHKVDSSTKNTYWSNGASRGLLTMESDVQYVQPDVLIMGGEMKKFDDHHLTDIIQNVETLIITGSDSCRNELQSVCYGAPIIINSDLQHVIRLCEFLFKDKCILFSPGFLPSQGTILNRIHSFIDLCREL